MNQVPIPSDLPLLVGKSTETDAMVSLISSRGNPDESTLFDNLCSLTGHVKVKVWLDCPVHIHKTKRRFHYDAKEAIIGKFFKGSTGWGYSPRHERVRMGYSCPWVSHIIKYEPVIEKQRAARHEGFKSLEAFARRFDPRFATPEEIESLYNSKSGQHGGKYMPSDFHKIGPRGKEVLERFLRGFKGLDVEGPYYCESSSSDGNKYKYYTERYQSYHHTGRDISISHTLGVPRVFYSSEFSGTANGRYGMLATESTFLWLEDD